MSYPSADRSIVGLPLQRLRAHFRRLPSELFGKLSLVALASLMLAGYSTASMPVTLVVNGRHWPWQTHQTAVHGLLREAGISLRPEDVTLPSSDVALSRGAVVQVTLARPVAIEADGRELQTVHPSAAPARHSG